MKPIRLLYILLLAAGLMSCEDTIDVNLDEGKTLLAVDGWITDQPGPYTVNLTRTAPYFTNAPTPRVQGAIVVIRDNEGNEERLQETAPGKYQTSTLRGKIGNTYTLRVRLENEEYTAQTQIQRVPPIDSLGVELKKESNFWDEGYYVLYFGPELPGVGDNYRFKIYRNDTLLNRVQDLIFAQDKYVDGNYIKDIELNDDPFKVGDVVRVENWSITDDAFQFYQELIVQIQNGGLFANPPANVRTNIKNVDPNGKQAVGYFGGSAVSSKTVTIRPQ